MVMLRGCVVAVAVALGTLGGAAAQEAEPSEPPAVQPMETTSVPDLPVPVVRPGGPLVRVGSAVSPVERARLNAAARTGVALDQIVVLGVEPTEWTDIRLGCPSLFPRFRVPEVMIPGYIVDLDVGGVWMRYHTDGGLRALLCEQAPPPPSEPGT
jgi:hypothetical protein